MELLPALAAESANPAHRGSNGQRNQRYECGKAHSDERALRDVFEHSRKIEGLVRSEISEKVQGDVKKSEEPEHAAEADEVRELEELAERRDAKGEDEKPQRPIAGCMLDELDGIGAQVAGKQAPNQNAKRNQTEKEDSDLGPLTGEDSAHEAILS